MSRPWVLTLTLAAAAATNIALAQASAGGALTLNGAAATGGVATLDTQRQIGITSSGDDHLITFLVKGTMASGQAISEVVAGTNGGVGVTTQNFLTVTSITASGAVAGTVSVGTTSTGSSQWFIVDNVVLPTQIGFELQKLAGAATATIETTGNCPLQEMPIYRQGYDFTPPVPEAFPWPTLTNVAIDAQGTIQGATIEAWRITLNGAAGSWRVSARQTGITVT